MKTRNLLLVIFLLMVGTALGTRALWPSVRVIEGPPVQTTIDVTDETREAYEDRIARLEDDLAAAMNATPAINTTDTLWRDSVRTVQLACPAPGDTTESDPELPPAWYLQQAAFPDDPGEEGSASEVLIGVGGGLLTTQDQVRDVFMPGPVTGIQPGPDGMQYAFGQWPAPACRFRTKVEWGVGTVLFVEGLRLIFGGGETVVVRDSPDY